MRKNAISGFTRSSLQRISTMSTFARRQVSLFASWISCAAAGVQLGEKFAVTAEFRLPWGVNPSLLTAEPADGSQLCAEPKFILKNIRWGYTLWSGDVELQSYAEGEIRDGRMNASFSNNQNLSMKIPAFKSNPVPVDSSDLAVASRIDRKASVPYLLYTVIALAVLAVIALAVFLIRKHRRALNICRSVPQRKFPAGHCPETIPAEENKKEQKP